MSPHACRIPSHKEWLSREPGTAAPVAPSGITQHRGGAVDVTCGACGNRARVEVRPSRSLHKPALITERALRRAGWLYAEPWGIVEAECLRAARKAVRAGHVQLSLL